MDETVISWNLPNVISVIFMLLIIWIIFGSIGHFVFRNAPANKQASVALNAAQPAQVLGI